MAVDKSKQIYGWWVGCVDIDISCFCGVSIQVPPNIADAKQHVILICENCGEGWSAKLEIKPKEEEQGDEQEEGPSESLKYQNCPQCHRQFRLTWNDYSDRPQTLLMRGCPSGGIYDVSIQCPHCKYEEDL